MKLRITDDQAKRGYDHHYGMLVSREGYYAWQDYRDSVNELLAELPESAVAGGFEVTDELVKFARTHLFPAHHPDTDAYAREALEALSVHLAEQAPASISEPELTAIEHKYCVEGDYCGPDHPVEERIKSLQAVIAKQAPGQPEQAAVERVKGVVKAWRESEDPRFGAPYLLAADMIECALSGVGYPSRAPAQQPSEPNATRAPWEAPIDLQAAYRHLEAHMAILEHQASKQTYTADALTADERDSLQRWKNFRPESADDVRAGFFYPTDLLAIIDRLAPAP